MHLIAQHTTAFWMFLAFALSVMPVIFGNINQTKAGVPQNNRWFPCPSAVTSGMPVLIGSQNGPALAAVALDAYDSSTGGTTFQLDGTFALTVIGQSTQSPVGGIPIGPGAEIYATGTYDATTGVTYNLTLDATIGNTPFGNLDQTPGILANVTNSAALVRLKVGGSGPYAR